MYLTKDSLRPQAFRDIDACLQAEPTDEYNKSSPAYKFLTEDIEPFCAMNAGGKNILAVASGSGDAALAIVSGEKDQRGGG